MKPPAEFLHGEPHGESVDKTFTCPGLPSEAGMHRIPAPPSPLGPFLALALPPPSRLCSVPQLEQTFKMQLGTRHPLSQAPGPWHPEEQPSHLCSQHNPSSPRPTLTALQACLAPALAVPLAEHASPQAAGCPLTTVTSLPRPPPCSPFTTRVCPVPCALPAPSRLHAG